MPVNIPTERELQQKDINKNCNHATSITTTKLGEPERGAASTSCLHGHSVLVVINSHGETSVGGRGPLGRWYLWTRTLSNLA